MRLAGAPRPGHGSMVHDENAVTILAEAVARHRAATASHWCSPTSVQGFFDEITALTGIEFPTDSAAALDGAVAKLGRGRPRSSARPSATPRTRRCSPRATRPTSSPRRRGDGRLHGSCPAGRRPVERDSTRSLGPDVEREFEVRDIAVETAFAGELVDTMSAAVQGRGPGRGHRCPYMMTGGTDAKSFSKLGMRCFGFSPLRLPTDLDFTRCSTASTSGCPSTR